MIRVHTGKPTKPKLPDSDDSTIMRRPGILRSIGSDGLPQDYKVVYYPTVDDRNHNKDLVPIYQTCPCCEMSVGRVEEEFKDELDGHCIECFKNITGQAEPSPFGEFLCTSGKCTMARKDLRKLEREKSIDPIKIKLDQYRSRKMKEKK